MVNKIGVLGAGQMGSGIAHVFAQQEYEVILFDIAEDQLQKALTGITKNLERQANKGLVDSNAIPAIVGRIKTSQNSMKFNIMVTTISLVLNLPFKKPAMAPTAALPNIAAATIKGMTSPGERTAFWEVFAPKAYATAKADKAPV